MNQQVISLFFPPEIAEIIVQYTDGEEFFRRMLPRIHNWFAGKNLLVIYRLNRDRSFQKVEFTTRSSVVDQLNTAIKKFEGKPLLKDALMVTRDAVNKDFSVRLLVKFMMPASPWEHVFVFFHGPYLN